MKLGSTIKKRQNVIKFGKTSPKILNNIEHPRFKVTDRSVSEYYNVLKPYNKQEAARNRGSGLEVDKENELDHCLVIA